MITKTQFLTDIIERGRSGSISAMLFIRLIKSNAKTMPEAQECLTWMQEYIRTHPAHDVPLLKDIE